MSNFKKIKDFDITEMTEFLLQIDSWGFNPIYCQRVCKYHNNCTNEQSNSCINLSQRDVIKMVLESDCDLLYCPYVEKEN